MRVTMLVLGMCLISCSMLKQSSKTEGLEHLEFEKVIDSRSLVLKSAVRETNTLTYNPDGSILHFQKVQEEVALSQAIQVMATENVSEKKELQVTETAPWRGWVWIGSICLTLVVIVVYIKLFR